jgi:hypothetical protein
MARKNDSSRDDIVTKEEAIVHEKDMFACDGSQASREAATLIEKVMINHNRNKEKDQ